MSNFLQQIGTIGVVLFFVLAGSLFHFDRYTFKEFFLKKILYLAIPWFLSGTIVYLYVYLRKPPISFISWINYIIGNGSYLYYLTLLIAFYLLFWFIKFFRSTVVLVLLSAVTIVSVVFFSDKGYLSPYLDVMNWIGYFSFGMLIKRYKDKAVCVYSFLKRFSFLFCINFFILFFVRFILSIKVGYWGYQNFLFILIGSISFVFFSTILVERKNVTKKIVCIGDNSLFIYLWHMPIAGIITNLMNRHFLVYGVLVRPFLVLAIMILSHKFLLLVLKNSKYIKIMIGLSR